MRVSQWPDGFAVLEGQRAWFPPSERSAAPAGDDGLCWDNGLAFVGGQWLLPGCFLKHDSRDINAAATCTGIVLSATWTELIPGFAGLSERQFRHLVTAVTRRGGAEVVDGRPGRLWCLPLADRVLLVAVYYRTNLTMRQVAPLLGIKQAAVHRIIDRLAPFLAISPVVRRHSPERVLIVDGTLVPVRDHAYQDSGAAWATRGATIIADGAYHGLHCAGVVIPHRRNRDDSPLPDWKEHHNRSHRHVRARVEHVFARMKNWKIFRDCRRRGLGAAHAIRGIAFMRNFAATI